MDDHFLLRFGDLDSFGLLHRDVPGALYLT
jgi:hypothetical protein